MKKIILFLLLCISSQAGEKNFKAVEKKLDSGADVYMIMDFESWYSKTSKILQEFFKIGMATESNPREKKEMAEAGKLIEKMIKETGFNEIGGIGFSSKKINKTHYSNKIFIQKKNATSQKFMWASLGKPKKLDVINHLPQSTYAAISLNMKYTDLFNFMQNMFKDLKQRELREVNRVFDNIKKQKDVYKLMTSIEAPITFILTADKNKMMKIPAGNSKLFIPTPAISYIIDINNIDAYKAAASQLPKPQAPIKGLEDCTVHFMPERLPTGTQLAMIAWKKKIIFSTDFNAAKEILSTIKSGNGLSKTPEFKTLQAGNKLEGNGFSYFSPKFNNLFRGTIEQIAKENATPAGITELILKYASIPSEFTIIRSDNDGILIDSTSTASIKHLFAVPVIAISAAMVMPALAKARGKAQQVNTLNNLKQLGIAVYAYDTDNNKMPESLADLWLYANSGKLYVKGENKNAPRNAKEVNLKTDFIYLGKGKKMSKIKDPSTEPMIITKPGKDPAVLFYDGHVRTIEGNYFSVKDIIKAAKAAANGRQYK